MLWPFFPNWSQDYTETYAYLTEIIASDNGSEQRRSWRLKARRQIEYTSLLHKDRFRAFRRQMRNQVQEIQFPDEPHRINTTSSASAGSLTATFSLPLPSWVVAGREVVFEDRKTRERFLREIDSVVGNTVTFVTVTDRAWASGTRMMPLLTGTLEASIQSTASSDITANGAIKLMVEPGQEVETAGLAQTVYRGLEVLTHRPNWAQPVNIESLDSTKYVDFDMGVRQAYKTTPFNTDIYQQNHLIRDRPQLDQVLGLFFRAQGRRGEFYAPTWLGDIDLLSITAAGSNIFAVPGHEFFDAYDGDKVYRSFSVRMKDNSLHFFRITNMAKSTSGTPRTLVTVAENAAVDIGPANIKAVSWMPVCRFSSDEMTVVWTTDLTAEIMISLLTLEDLT